MMTVWQRFGLSRDVFRLFSPFGRGKLAVFLLLCCTLPACSTLRNGGAPEPSFDIAADLGKLAAEFESATNISAYYRTPVAERLDARNRFISGRLVQIDLRYLQFIKTLTSDKQQLDSATDIANLTLNLAGTLGGAVRAKTNLAAAAAGVGGTKTIIDKDYYYEKSIDALVATMNAKRKEVLIGVLTGLSKPLNQYPFERALTDLQQYYLAGTLNGALQFINTQAVQSETDSDTKIRRLSIPSGPQITDVEHLTDAIGAQGLTLDNAKKALKAIGVADAQLPATLDDKDGKPGARRMLKDEIRKAENIAGNDARTAAIKKLSDAFKAAGIIQ